jgi:hypothetical protein
VCWEGHRNCSLRAGCWRLSLDRAGQRRPQRARPPRIVDTLNSRATQPRSVLKASGPASGTTPLPYPLEPRRHHKQPIRPAPRSDEVLFLLPARSRPLSVPRRCPREKQQQKGVHVGLPSCLLISWPSVNWSAISPILYLSPLSASALAQCVNRTTTPRAPEFTDSYALGRVTNSRSHPARPVHRRGQD